MEGTTAGAVAVLDDDIRFLRMVERALQSHGLRVQPVTTPDPRDAVRVVEQSDVRAALIDIFMYGEAAGFEVIDRLRTNPATARLPIIVTSGARREIARKRDFLRDARCAVLEKPFGIDELLCCIDRAIAGDDPAAAIVGIAVARERRLSLVRGRTASRRGRAGAALSASVAAPPRS